MRMKSRLGILARRLPRAAAVCVVLIAGGCSINSPSIPNIFGPSTLALNITMTATPDAITADAVSRSTITVLVRDQNGQPKPGVPLIFSIQEAGFIVALGSLSTQNATTDANGYAVTYYTAPARTDVNNQIFVQIAARALQGDAAGTFYHTVTLEILPAEPGLFPQIGGTLICNFIIEPAQPGSSFAPGNQVLFEDSSSDPNKGGRIDRWQWNFGDGTIGDDSPDVNHAYGASGVFTVTHVINDQLGAQATCTQSISVLSTPISDGFKVKKP